MPPLLSYDPTGATFSPVTPAQYLSLTSAMKVNAKVSKLLVDGYVGSCEVQGVDFAWKYDGTSSLHVAITAKHGFITSHVPNATIFDELNKQLMAGV
jgi:hypothetical protein